MAKGNVEIDTSFRNTKDNRGSEYGRVEAKDGKSYERQEELKVSTKTVKNSTM